MNFISPRVIWKFSRPHTIIGSALSIVSIFLLVLSSVGQINKNNIQIKHPTAFEESNHTPEISNPKIGFIPNIMHTTQDYLNLLIPTLFACLLCNLFITGLNQITDVPIDAINKPKLPIVSGELNKTQATFIVGISIVFSLIVSFLHDLNLFYLILIIGLIGAAYSLPPIRLKEKYSWASIAIALVRGPLINIGIAYHFIKILSPESELSEFIWLTPLTLFITCFSIGIAWFKDIPDTDGDKQFHVRTLAATFSKEKALQMGTFLIIGTYIFMGLVWFFIPKVDTKISILLLITHALLLGIFYNKSRKTDLTSKVAIQKFYKFYWILFFTEYLILPFFLGFNFTV